MITYVKCSKKITERRGVVEINGDLLDLCNKQDISNSTQTEPHNIRFIGFV